MKVVQLGRKSCPPCVSIRPKLSKLSLEMDIEFEYVDLDHSLSDTGEMVLNAAKLEGIRRIPIVAVIRGTEIKLVQPNINLIKNELKK